MATNTVYVTAGLPVTKNSGQSPGAGENTAYVTAGLPPVVEAAGGNAPTGHLYGSLVGSLGGPV